MNRTISNFLLIFPILLFLLVACNPNYNPDKKYKSGNEVKSTTKNSKVTSIEYITGYLTNNGNTDTGLYKVTLEDGREILIYKGGEYATMIQLK
jgi:hypothetical protein